MEGESQPGRLSWLISVVRIIIWQGSGNTLARVSWPGAGQAIGWSFWSKSGGLDVVGAAWPGIVSWGPLWLRSACLGAADLGRSGSPDSSCVLAEVGQGEAKELALLGLPHGHG